MSGEVLIYKSGALSAKSYGAPVPLAPLPLRSRPGAERWRRACWLAALRVSRTDDRMNVHSLFRRPGLGVRADAAV
jgi:hypothetical protein